MVFGWERTGITPANRGDLGGVVGMSRARKKDRECDSLGSNTMAKAEGGGELHSGGLRWCLRLPSIWSSLSSDEILRQQATCSWLYGDDGGVRVSMLEKSLVRVWMVIHARMKRMVRVPR
ncbi:hypothetical protein L1987_32918 [Smallanthus sonchifolius]|uniref:Uncharacterized protein n=1 Tax=Smallanthus sonchifolius TaxID=185202 RepID=A0ACB9HPX3_9ASTR|nr:hypothetical protein L1987_32918 [Smallanthus sonchifolius]